MMSEESSGEPLRLLIADRRGWIARSLINVLDASEWKVEHCHGALDLLRTLASQAVHAIVLHDDLDDMPLQDLLPRLRGHARIGVLIPIVVLSTRAHRGRRLELLRAGATEHFLFPSDPESLLLRLRSLALAGREADRLRRAAMLEPGTALYTEAGIAHRGREISTDALRRHDPLSCVVIATPEALAPEHDERSIEIESASELGGLVRRIARTSDAVGRLGRVVVVIAPATGERGARRLAERIREAIVAQQRDVERAHPSSEPGRTPASSSMGERQVRASYCSVADYSRSPVDLPQMIERAAAALRVTADTGQLPPIQGETISVSTDADPGGRT